MFFEVTKALVQAFLILHSLQRNSECCEQSALMVTAPESCVFVVAGATRFWSTSRHTSHTTHVIHVFNVNPNAEAYTEYLQRRGLTWLDVADVLLLDSFLFTRNV
jgi:hypothetical protein